ncbi:MAG: TIGR03557 family F420-dependent LLM class oxidoreductase [Dehalococcoidia bacterium]|nr:TIGR03557 family F420-dependent LLM class oxidoreductase [Dehalococcoidia bacterium]
MKLGYAIASEEHQPRDLVRYAQMAEEAGFSFALISDHYHPWIDQQGHSPFVWSVIGAIAEATSRIELGTGVTCPTTRIHPAIIAQAAATSAVMMPGRFFLGVGTGEALNEHILGQQWPPANRRLEMLEEAIEVIRLLWQGGYKSHYGRFYTVENARIYTLPESPPPVVVAASGPESAELAGRVGDAFCSTSPDEEVVRRFNDTGGAGKPRYGMVTVCWASDEASARVTALKQWPNAAIGGQLSQELALPLFYEQAAETVTEDHIAEFIACGPDAEKHIEMINKYAAGGFDHICVHQVGPDQEGFFGFYQREIMPALDLVPSGLQRVRA